MAGLDATFEVKDWQENPFDEAEGTARLTQAAVQRSYSGDLQGTSATVWVMAYAPDDTAAFVGIERITGTVAGLEGTLVLRHVGTFEGGAATADLTVLSGTGALEGATGTGSFVADPSGRVSLDLTTPTRP
jgi:hypothetical protein